jgi:hypothetical protein
MSRRNHKNIRTEFKLIWKDFQRGTITKEEITDLLKHNGFLGDVNWLNLILRLTKVKPRILARLGRAARKRGKLVRLIDIYWVARLKEGDYPPARYVARTYKKATDYHLIEFVNLEDVKK